MATPASHKPYSIHQMTVGRAFNSLTDQEKRYAHHLARAAWHGTRIILEQVSPEANAIYDFILELHKSCKGQWAELGSASSLQQSEIDAFVRYSVTFLSNIGNFYGRGDQKFTPSVDYIVLERLAAISTKTETLWQQIRYSISTLPPHSLGYPTDLTLSQYYPTVASRLTEHEIKEVTKALEGINISPENTRLRKDSSKDNAGVVTVLQASIETHTEPTPLDSKTELQLRLKRGDHQAALRKICAELTKAADFASNNVQKAIIEKYIQSFTTGNLEAYKESQKLWIKDHSPRVENIFGFVEPYRDPAGVRAEFEALVAIEDPEESKILRRLVERSDHLIRQLPWARGATENDGKGRFERVRFEPPSFAGIHSQSPIEPPQKKSFLTGIALAYCSTILFDGINLPNYNDIRDEHGFKNVLISNRMAALNTKSDSFPFIDDSEAAEYSRYQFHATYICLVVHELLGHGTGRMMVQSSDDVYNFDIDHPPVNPLTGESITSWYKPGETWTGKFGDLATAVEECRAELVGACLMANKDLLAIFGFDDGSDLKASDLTYYYHIQMCVAGLRALSNFNTQTQKWGQAHDRGRFAMLQVLLKEGNGSVKIEHQVGEGRLKVCVDRERMLQDGLPALETLLLKLHMYRVTADIGECRPYFEALSAVEGEALKWREIVISKSGTRLNYVHANTFLENDGVRLQEYEATDMGVLQSWADRDV